MAIYDARKAATPTPWYRQPAFLGGLRSASSGLLAAAQPGPVGQRSRLMAQTLAGIPGAMQTAGASEMQRRLYEQQVAAGERTAALAPLQTRALEQQIATRDRTAQEANRLRLQREQARQLFGSAPGVTEGPITTDLGTGGSAATLAQIGRVYPEAVMQARLRQLTSTPTTPKLQAVMDYTDPENPIQRFVSQQEAMNNKDYQPIPSGMKVQSDGQGGFQLVTGTATLTKPTMGAVEKKIISSSDMLDKLNAAGARFKKEYHQIEGRFGAMKTAVLEKAEGTWITDWLGSAKPEEKQFLGEFTAYKATTAETFTQILKELSGVAVNPNEYKRAEAFIPNVGSGLFDGDSPSQVKAKRENMQRFVTNALRKYHYIRRNDLSVTDPGTPGLEQMPKIMQDRGQELYIQYSGQGLSPEQILDSVTRKLIEEFGA